MIFLAEIDNTRFPIEYINFIVTNISKNIQNIIIDKKKNIQIGIHYSAYNEFITKANSHLSNFSNPNIYMIAGCYSHYLLKCKPIYFEYNGTVSYSINYLNEFFAFMLGIIIASHQSDHPNPKIPVLEDYLIYDVLLSLKYHTYTPVSMATLFLVILETFK